MEPGSHFDTLAASLDAYRRLREPSARELFAELKNTVWTCAALNASTCASFPPRLYVLTRQGDPAPKCLTRKASPRVIAQQVSTEEVQIEEVVSHPLLTLLQKVNPVHNGYDLWELTTLYQETTGHAYWLLDFDPVLGIPSQIWPLPAHKIRPVREADEPEVVSYYEYFNGSEVLRLPPRNVIHFRYPDPREPYLGGLSPLRACFESASLASIFLAYKRSIWDNAALPGAVLSPTEAISPEERDRLEKTWNQRFRRGGNGRVIVAESALNVDVLSTSLADVAALAEAGATQADIANAFGIPLAFLSTDTNLANLVAAERQHAAKTIRPRLGRRDEKLNEQLVPLYDPTGRLFLMSDNPVLDDREAARLQEEQDLRLGVRSINQVRSDRGLPPVSWGDVPWMPISRVRTDSEVRDRLLRVPGEEE
jgi:HK97 family phage portal protein